MHSGNCKKNSNITIVYNEIQKKKNYNNLFVRNASLRNGVIGSKYCVCAPLFFFIFLKMRVGALGAATRHTGTHKERKKKARGHTHRVRASEKCAHTAEEKKKRHT